MVNTWLLGFALAVVLLQLLGMVYLYVARDRDEPAGMVPENAAAMPQENDPATTADDAIVTCSACGTENAPEYRYCRQCVADLSGDAVPVHQKRSPASRLF